MELNDAATMGISYASQLVGEMVSLQLLCHHVAMQHSRDSSRPLIWQ